MIDVNVFLNAANHNCCHLRGSGVVIRGAPHSGKSSLAFQAAINVAQRGERVLVICHEQILYTKVPRPFTPLDSVDSQSLALIEFVYVTSFGTALAQLAKLPVVDFPSLIVVDNDGIDGFSPASQATATSVLLSALMNVSDWRRRCMPAGSFFFVYADHHHHPACVDNAISDASPAGAFPIVTIDVSANGVVSVRPIPGDHVVVNRILVSWGPEGLELRE